MRQVSGQRGRGGGRSRWMRRVKRRERSAALGALLLLAVCTTGCSIYRPFIVPAEAIPTDGKTTYEVALKYAVSARDGYQSAANVQAGIVPVVGGAMIPIG